MRRKAKAVGDSAKNETATHELHENRRPLNTLGRVWTSGRQAAVQIRKLTTHNASSLCRCAFYIRMHVQWAFNSASCLAPS